MKHLYGLSWRRLQKKAERRKKMVSKMFNLFTLAICMFMMYLALTLPAREERAVNEGKIKVLAEENKELSQKLQRRMGFEAIYQEMVVTATAYCNCDKCINVPAWRDGKTSTNTIARVGVIAVDPKVIPLGSSVIIEGYGMFKAEDTGSKIKGYRIDIFHQTQKEAEEFGVKKLKVWVKKI